MSVAQGEGGRPGWLRGGPPCGPTAAHKAEGVDGGSAWLSRLTMARRRRTLLRRHRRRRGGGGAEGDGRRPNAAVHSGRKERREEGSSPAMRGNRVLRRRWQPSGDECGDIASATATVSMGAFSVVARSRRSRRGAGKSEYGGGERKASAR